MESSPSSRPAKQALPDPDLRDEGAPRLLRRLARHRRRATGQVFLVTRPAAGALGPDHVDAVGADLGELLHRPPGAISGRGRHRDADPRGRRGDDPPVPTSTMAEPRADSTSRAGATQPAPSPTVSSTPARSRSGPVA